MYCDQSKRGHLALIIEAMLGKKREYFLPCICNNFLLTVILALCLKIKYYCCIVMSKNLCPLSARYVSTAVLVVSGYLWMIFLSISKAVQPD